MRAFVVAILILLTLGVGPRATADPPTTCADQNVTDTRSTDFADFLTGTDETDIVALGDGEDQYFAAGSPDVVCGGDGNDTLAGENGGDDLNGGPGDDVLAGFQGGDDLQGGAGLDEIRGYGGGDVLRAGGDDLRDDVFDGGGSDVILGTAEDVWHKCDDNTPDDHDGFDGLIVPDPDCAA